MSGKQRSAGILAVRGEGAGLEFFLVHPGGPLWANKDEGAWSVPKGLLDPGEDPLTCAKRELVEETGFTAPEGPYVPLGSVKQKAGKTIHAWAWEGDADPDCATSNTMRIEWPRDSGTWIEFPPDQRFRLLAYLAHSGAWQGRPWLSFLFWPDVPTQEAPYRGS